MNSRPTASTHPDDAIVELVAFKWLMAGQGWWIDLARLRRDKVYAGECLRHALESGSQCLRRHSVEVMPLLECVAAA
jgi:hypothetical protein